MSRSLAITVRFLEGRYHGAGRWPPDPARLFQALVAGAARGAGLPERARDALAWLERRAPPSIFAPPARRAQAVRRWVPNNDADARLGGQTTGYAGAVASVRTAKAEHPWLFEVETPLLYLWELGEEAVPPEALTDVVEGLYRLGRGTDPAFATLEVLGQETLEARLSPPRGSVHWPGAGSEDAVPCEGTLASLERRHDAFVARFARHHGTLAFRQPPKPRVRLVSYDAPPQRVIYHLRQTTPEAAGGFKAIPLTEAASLVNLVLRQAAERLAAAIPEQAGAVDRMILGKNASKKDKLARIRLIPLPSSGHAEVDPSIRRLLLEVPSGCDLPLADLDWAFGTITPHSPETGEVLDWRLERSTTSDTIGRHLCDTSQVWRTLTPIVLPEPHRGRSGAARRAGLERSATALRQALRHAGIRTEPVDIRIQPEPFHKRGARAGSFSTPSWIAPSRLAHAELRFAAPVSGPLLLGDGRYRGLGLLEPVSERANVFLFALGGADVIDAEAVAVAARRAVMARVAPLCGKGPLPTFFTGHDPDGAPARHGRRSHIAVLVDPVRRHLVFATPQAQNRGSEPSAEDIRHTRTLGAALAGFDRLLAGRAGAFDLMRLHDPDAPLLASAHIWESLTDWRPCRHGKAALEDWIAKDVQRDCTRRNLPLPQAVEIVQLSKGSRGAVHARLRLHFAREVEGPISLGSTAMRGGGVFTASS